MIDTKREKFPNGPIMLGKSMTTELHNKWHKWATNKVNDKKITEDEYKYLIKNLNHITQDNFLYRVNRVNNKESLIERVFYFD